MKIKQNKPYLLFDNGETDLQDAEIINNIVTYNAIMKIEGALDCKSYDDIVCAIYDFVEDPQVAKIIMFFDSPGGDVDGCWDACEAISYLNKQKPIIVYTSSMLCSAAYALASNCSKIIANKSAMVGSIGVITHLISISKQLQDSGIDVKSVKSGEAKDDGDQFLPISKSAIENTQNIIDELALQFFEIVSKNRGLSATKIKNMNANVFLGEVALKNGLIDGVMGISDFISKYNK